MFFLEPQVIAIASQSSERYCGTHPQPNPICLLVRRKLPNDLKDQELTYISHEQYTLTPKQSLGSFGIGVQRR
jgi:hypothetical protein